MGFGARLASVTALALSLLLSACGAGDRPVATERTFEATYANVIWTVQARFEHNGWVHKSAGDSLDLHYDLDFELSDGVPDELMNRVTGIWVAWAGERLWDPQGRYRQVSNTLSSTALTVTGLPIESGIGIVPSRKAGSPYGTPFDFAEFHPMEPHRGKRKWRLSGGWSKVLDDSVPPGLYRPIFDFLIQTSDGKVEALSTLSWDRVEYGLTNLGYLLDPHAFLDQLQMEGLHEYLPAFQVGEMKAPPRIPWVLFPDVHVNGAVGIVANEDRGRFAISSRFRYPTELIMPPGPREIFPCFLTAFPRASGLIHPGGAETIASTVDHFLDYENGWADIAVKTPAGERVELGRHRFAGLQRDRGGPGFEDGPVRFDFAHPGKYTVTMRGEIRDITGRVIVGGGDYDVWVAHWLTFSSTAKPGLPFPVGSQFPGKLDIHPSMPAHVEITVDFFPNSEVARRRRVVMKGEANPFGFFFPKADAPAMHFDEPGEYRAEFRARYTAPDGSQWYGSQLSGGIVYGPDSDIELHGVRSSQSYAIRVGDESSEPKARYDLAFEARTGLRAHPLLAASLDALAPYYSGDTVKVAAAMTGLGLIDAHLSFESRNPAIRQEGEHILLDGPIFLSPLGEGGGYGGGTLPTGTGKAPEAPPRGNVRMVMRPNLETDAAYTVGGPEPSDMLPVLSLNRHGYHPFSFPEFNDVEAYTYFTALRPGFVGFAMVSDATARGAYWSTGPNTFGDQFAAGVNGDLPNDIYLLMGGLVRRDLRTGHTDYSPYFSTVSIEAADTYSTRTVAPLSEPLGRVNGREAWMALGMSTTDILVPGDRISTGAMVLPNVPAKIEEWVRWPNEGHVERISGTANRYGFFKGKVLTLDEPGVYQVFAEAHYKGRVGRVFGSGDGVFNHYVVKADPPDILRLDLPARSAYDVTRVLEIPLLIAPGYRNPRITYSVIFPGMIMDEGVFSPEESRHIFRFLPSQFAMQFPNFDIVNYSTGRPRLNDVVLFVFLAEATGPDGKKAYDAAQVFLRGDAMYYFEPETHGPAEPGRGNSGSR